MSSTPRRCPGVTRRSFLADTGLGFTGLALGAILFKDGVARAAERPDGKPHFAPKAKSVIWIFLCGGVSHVESFDPKPELNKFNGKTIDEIEKRATFLRLARGNRYREVKPRKGVWTSKVLTGFWLRPEWFWMDPRPRKADVLAQILAEPRG